MLWKGVYHREKWTGPRRVSPRVPVAFGVDWVVLHWEHTRAVMRKYGGLYQRMHEKSCLQINYTF